MSETQYFIAKGQSLKITEALMRENGEAQMNLHFLPTFHHDQAAFQYCARLYQAAYFLIAMHFQFQVLLHHRKLRLYQPANLAAQ